MSARLGLVVIIGAPVIAIGVASYIVFGRYDASLPAATLTPSLPAPPDVDAAVGSPITQRLRAAITSGRLHEQAEAVDALALVTIPSTAPLLYLALEASPVIRIKAANALGDMRLVAAVPRLRAALAKTREPEQEIQVAAVLYRLGDKDVRTTLNTATLHANTRIFAAVALADAGDELSRKTLAEIVKTTPKGRDYWRLALGGLAKLGDEPARTTLETELGHRDVTRALAAAALLARGGNAKGLDQLVRFASDKDFDHPGEAALALARLGDKRALPWVTDGLASPDAEERKHAIAIATTFAAREHAPAIARLAKSDPDDAVRFVAEVASLAF